MNYVDALPNEIKGLQFTKSNYSKVPFGAMLRNYYDDRIEYINKFLLDKTATIENEDDFWD